MTQDASLYEAAGWKKFLIEDWISLFRKIPSLLLLYTIWWRGHTKKDKESRDNQNFLSRWFHRILSSMELRLRAYNQ